MTRPQPPGHPLSEQQRQTASLDRIGDALLDAIPDGWRRVDLMVKMSVAVQDLALGQDHLQPRPRPGVGPADSRVALGT